MSISPEVIHEVSQRFQRERDRYQKLTRVIEELCVDFFVERSGLLVNITARTKSEPSLRKKLYRMYSRQEKAEWSAVDDVFDGLSDFSGVRIAFYSKTDLQTIRAGLGSIFEVGNIEEKDKYRENLSEPKFYKATHFQVSLRTESLSNENDNLFGLSAEVQVCSMMEHVWNEIEHDIGYKPKGKLSDEESQCLRKLGLLTREGDRTIEKLLEAHRKRVSKEDQIESLEALTEFLGTTFVIGRITFRENADSLYEAMQRLKIDSKVRLLEAMGFTKANQSDKTYAREKWARAKRDLQVFSRYLRNGGYSAYDLRARNSADPALMLILQHGYSSILSSEPAGRGRGRPSRIRSLATRYDQFISRQAKR